MKSFEWESWRSWAEFEEQMCWPIPNVDVVEEIQIDRISREEMMPLAPQTAAKRAWWRVCHGPQSHGGYCSLGSDRVRLLAKVGAWDNTMG